MYGYRIMINSVQNNNYINIINDFRSLIDFINYNDILIEKMFQILKKYFQFNVAGLFFNSPDILDTNILHLFISDNSSDIKYIEDTFFNEIATYKQIIKQSVTTYYQFNKLQIIKNNEYQNEFVLPFTFNGKLLGGMCIFSTGNMFNRNIDIFNLLISEFLSIFKLKYIFQEQIFKSSIDPLTGLYNRNQFDIGLEQEFNRSQRYKNKFSVAMIDIDHFKSINDTYGHQFGDYVLIEISKIIQHAFRKTDIVYRYGGEEIVILMPETDAEYAYLPLEKLRDEISSHKFKRKNVTVSIGISDCIGKNSAQEVLEQADKMLYKAKNNGRNRVVK